MRGRITKRDVAVPGGLFLGALAIRLVGIGFGLPYMYYWDEGFIASPVKNFLAAGELFPHFYHYPSGYMYLQFLAAPISYLIFILKNGPAPVAAMELSDYLLVGRSLTAVIGAAAAVLVYWFAVRLWRDRLAGTIAGILLALSPLSVADSRALATDVPMAAAAFLGVFLIFLYLERGDWKTLIAAGAVMGAAVGVKYNAALFAAVGVVVVAFRDRNCLRPIVFAGTAVLAFLVLVPGIIFEHRVFFQDVLMVSKYYFVTGEPKPAFVFPLWHYFGQLWSYGLTPGPLVLAAAGLALFI
jgi:4-amino-4-deoxy-L-arabinose transferase-like glycosyltransferase